MYILIVSRGVPSAKYKTNGIFEFDQARALAKAGCKVVYAAVDVRSIRRWRKWGFEHCVMDGVEVYIINIPVGRVPKGILHSIAKTGLNVLYNRIEREHGRPDILHTHFAESGYISSVLRKRLNIPFIITEHSSGLMKNSIDKSLYLTAKKAYTKVDFIIAVSPALKEVIEKRFEISAKYIPNIVDTSIFDYKEEYKKEYKKDKIYRFVSTGSLIYRKRMDMIIEAVHRGFRDNINVTLTIFGEGEERPVLEKLIDSYNLNDRVKLMGVQSRKEIAKALKGSDCFVLPSRFETFGVAYIEALASGIPVIATKCGGPESFMNKSNGLLIPTDDIKSLISAMQYIYKHGSSFDSGKISDDIKEKFSPEKIAGELIEVYKKVKR